VEFCSVRRNVKVHNHDYVLVTLCKLSENPVFVTKKGKKPKKIEIKECKLNDGDVISLLTPVDHQFTVTFQTKSRKRKNSTTLNMLKKKKKKKVTL